MNKVNDNTKYACLILVPFEYFDRHLCIDIIMYVAVFFIGAAFYLTHICNTQNYSVGLMPNVFLWKGRA